MMQRLLSSLVALAWGLWFGGLMMLFVAVQSIFATFAPDRQTAGATAAGLFRRFEVFQLALAAATLLATLAWRMLSGRSRSKSTALACFALATLLAIGSTAVVTPQIQDLREQGQTDTARFRSLHGASMMLYVGGAAVLLVAGLVLPSAIRHDVRPRGDAGTGRAGDDDAKSRGEESEPGNVAAAPSELSVG